MRPGGSRRSRLSRLESLAALAGGVTHEMNNLAASVSLCVELLEPSCAAGADREMLLSLGGVARRLQHAGRQLHWLARGIEGEPTLFQPQYLLADVQKLSAVAFAPDVSLVVRYPPDLRALAGEPLHLHQLLLAMALEARHHLPPAGGTVILTAHNAPPDRVVLEASIDVPPAAASGGAAALTARRRAGAVRRAANTAGATLEEIDDTPRRGGAYRGRRAWLSAAELAGVEGAGGGAAQLSRPERKA